MNGDIMIIDFHTHAFPDKIAKTTIEALERNCIEGGEHLKACTDGSFDGLEKKLRESGVDMGVVLPIVTKEHQTETVNAFAKTKRGPVLFSFGSLHPESESWEHTLHFLAENGFRGIKLHPEYQGVYINSPRCKKIIAKAEELGLLVTVHAGWDAAYPAERHCTPERIADLLDFVSGKNLIAAHLGGMKMWDEVDRYLVGKPLYFDTACLTRYISPDVYRALIFEHGADRILFGSDCPWEDPKDSFELLSSLSLPKDDLDAICYKNALSLLGAEGTVNE